MKVDSSNKENEPNRVEPADLDVTPTPDDPLPTSPQPTPRGRTISRRSTNMKQGTQTDQPSSRLSGTAIRRAKSLDRKSYDSIGLSPELFNVKKGWLTIQDVEKSSWSKHWFVLGSKLLRYYKGSESEESSKLQGSIDLEKFVEVKEVELQRNYGFQVQLEDATYLLAAMTTGIRRNWMRAITSASQSPAHDLEATADKVKSGNDLSTKAGDEENKKLPPIDDKTVSERSQRRRARIQTRRKEGRARTFDFAEFRPLAEQALGLAATKDDNITDTTAKSDVKARSRTFDPDSLLSDIKRSNVTRVDSPSTPLKPTHDNNANKTGDKVSSNLTGSVEDRWKKIEEIPYDTVIVNGDLPSRPAHIKETAKMVKALQSEVDSLRKQMDRVNLERSSSTEDYNVTTTDVGRPPVVKSVERGDQNREIEKIKQELTIAQEALRKQSSELRECSMQLDIVLSDAQVTETQLSNVRDELRLEKGRRQEEEKERLRKESAYKEQIESGDAELKKTETKLMESQRKIRELERKISIQSDHSKESSRLQDHIETLRENAEKQEIEMKELQDSYEAKCQNQKQLEDRLSESNELMRRYEDQIRDMKLALSDADTRDQNELDTKRIKESLRKAKESESNLKNQISKLLAQNKENEKYNQSIREDLGKEKELNKKLKNLLEERDAETQETDAALEKITKKLKAANEEKIKLQDECKSLKKKNKKLSEDLKAQLVSEQTELDLRARLAQAEKQLGDIDQLRNKGNSSASSFKAKVSELEAEMGDTGHMIAARLSALERPRRDSDSSNTSDKESLTQKNQRLEASLEKKTKQISSLEERLREAEERDQDANQQFTAKLKELSSKLESDSDELKNKLSEEKSRSQLLEEKLDETQICLQHLHQRATKISSTSFAPDVECGVLLQKILRDIQRLSGGDTSIAEDPSTSSTPRSPSPTEDVEGMKFQRITDAESRQQHQRTMSRLRQLTEKLKSSDGRLVSPSASPLSFMGLSVSPHGKGAGAKSDKTPPLSDDDLAKLFAKQVSTQALLLAEMAATLRRSQSSPSLSTVGRSQPGKGRPSATSPQLTSAEFSDTIARHTATGGLLQHVDALAQKLTLEGMLMREVAQLRDAWQASRGRGSTNQHRSSGSTSQQSDLSGAMVVHSHVSYVLQVYNERISRLSLEARQARHRADAAMRKLRELVDACKTQDLEAVSSLAVQVDTDTIAPPYAEVPPWEQQVDYGTLHGAESFPSSVATETMFLEQEATFFQHLADDLGSTSSDVQSLSKLGVQLLTVDSSLQRHLQASEIGEQASVVAKEAVVQAEIIYISHRLRRDYDEELRKAKSAVSDQAKHFEKFKREAKMNEEKAATRIKHITDEHNSKVERLKEKVSKLEETRAEMSDHMEESLNRLSRKHEQELASRIAKHEQETGRLRKDLATANSQLQGKTRDYMEEMKKLQTRLKEIELQHSKEGSEIREDYEKKFKKAKDDWQRDVIAAKAEGEMEVKKIKNESERKIKEGEAKFKDEILTLKKDNEKDKDHMTSQHKKEVEKLKNDHVTELARHHKEAEERESLRKREYEERMEKEQIQHKMALKNCRDDAIKAKTAELKKEYEKILENRDRLHKEQLEREKVGWSKELREEFDKELEAERDRWTAELAPSPTHARSGSITSESETREALRERITSLEEEIGSMQGKLDDEQRIPTTYKQKLTELKDQFDAGFASIEDSHAKQLEEMSAGHERALRALREKQDEDLDLDKEDTRRAIEAMRKHHQEEVRELQERLARSGLDDKSHVTSDVERLNIEIETLSEHYSKKCVELASALERIEVMEDNLRSLEREHKVLTSRNEELTKQMQKGFGRRESPRKKDDDEQIDSTKLYQLEVTLRVKASEIDYLKQEIISLTQQLDELHKEKKQSEKKHQSLFDDLTLARSQEAMVRRELNRLKEQQRRHTDESSGSDGEGNGTATRHNDGGYDFQKSRSQPDIPANPLRHATSSTSSVTSVKRRSSDRGKRNARN